MEKSIAAIIVGILATAGIVILIPLGTLFGAVCGSIVGWFFGDSILYVTDLLGLHNVTMWQYGAFLGFTGGFFRTSVSNNKT